MVYMSQRKDKPKLVKALVCQHFKITKMEKDVQEVLKFIEKNKKYQFDVQGAKNQQNSISLQQKVEMGLREQGLHTKYPAEFE